LSFSKPILSKMPMIFGVWNSQKLSQNKSMRDPSYMFRRLRDDECNVFPLIFSAEPTGERPREWKDIGQFLQEFSEKVQPAVAAENGIIYHDWQHVVFFAFPGQTVPESLETASRLRSTLGDLGAEAQILVSTVGLRKHAHLYADPETLRAAPDLANILYAHTRMAGLDRYIPEYQRVYEIAGNPPPDKPTMLREEA